MVVLWLGLEGLGVAGLLPPPQIANNLCADEKLAYLRTHRFQDPVVLAVGSSVTWRGFDGEAVTQVTGGRRATLNGAFCGLKMNQIAFTARYFVARYPSVRDVITIVAPQDFTECARTRERVFDPDDADDYVYRGAAVFPLYLKYFDPITLVKNALILKALRDGELALDSMEFDPYGGAPLDTALSRPDLVYNALPPLDPACFRDLRRLATLLASEGRRLIVVTAPVHPAWVERYDPQRAMMTNLADGIQTALAGTTAVFWDAHRAFAVANDQFIDAIHIRWAAAKELSRALVAATGVGRIARTH